MSTNYYRIPTENEMKVRKELLITRINEMELTPDNIESDFHCIVAYDPFSVASPWGEFLDGTKIHLGKRSGEWKFVWNFHKNKYYSNKEELLAFIRNGRVVSEYGDEIEVEEFIKMAIEWGEPDGYIYNEEYLHKNPGIFPNLDISEHYSKIIDGLIVSPHSEFC